MSDPWAVDGIDPAWVQWIDVAGVRTRYLDVGNGPPLVLLHGGEIGSLYSLDGWSLVVPLLARQFRVIAPDRVGQGHTANPPLPYRPDAMLDHARAFMEALDLRGAHVVGHSRGGLIATWLAQQIPERVASVVVVDSRTLAPEDPRYPNDVFYERLGHRQRLLAGEVTEETVALEPFAQCFYPAAVTRSFLDRMLEIAHLPKSLESRHAIRENRETVWLPEIYELRRNVLAGVDKAGVPVPTLVVWGLDDESAPLPVGIDLLGRLAARTSHVEMHVLSRARHYCFRDQPAAFSAAVASFCGRVVRPAG